LEGFQFNASDTSKQYADTSKNVSAINYTIRNCTNQSIQIRNSSYANFAAAKLAKGNGAITAIYSIFNTSKQLLVRDTSDIQFTNLRCNQQPVDTTNITTIKDLRALYKTSNVTLPLGTIIKAVVISNYENELSGNYKIQDMSGAGIMFFPALDAPVYPLGSVILINAGNATLQLFNGDLELANVPAYNIFPSENVSPVPRITNVKTIKDSAAKWIHSLVTIQNVVMSKSSSTSTGLNYNLDDGSGIIASFVRDSAGFILPDAVAASITGYVSQFDGVTQITLRTIEDVQGIHELPKPFTANYSFSNVTAASGTTDPTPVPLVNRITFGAFNAAGVSANPSAAGRFSFTQWGTGATNGSNSFTGSINLAKYYEVTITPDPGTKLNLTNITFSVQRSTTGVRQWSVRTSLDNFSSDIAATSSGQNVIIVSPNIFQIADRSVATVQTGCIVNFDNTYNGITQPIKIRFYGYNAESAAGSFSLNGVLVAGSVE
jgi:hypothetical protein